MKKFILMEDSIMVDSNWLRENDLEAFETLLDMVEGEEYIEAFRRGGWKVIVEFTEGNQGEIVINYYAGENRQEVANQPVWTSDTFNIDEWLENYSQAGAYTRKKLLEKAEYHIEEEMKERGYIDDSDNIDRFLDNLAMDLFDPIYDELLDISDNAMILLEEIKQEIMSKYKRICEVSQSADYKGYYYYDEDIEFRDIDDFEEKYGIKDRQEAIEETTSYLHQLDKEGKI